MNKIKNKIYEVIRDIGKCIAKILSKVIPVKKNSILFIEVNYKTMGRKNIDSVYKEIKKNKKIKVRLLKRNPKKNFLLLILKDVWILYQILRHEKIVSSQGIILKTQKNINFEIQHGSIHENQSDYIISEEEKNTHTFPDYLITYGNYEKELLTKKSCWDKNKIMPVGCPRYDFLANYKINKTKLKEKLGIPKNKKILFWPTQTHDRLMSKNGENELNAEVIFKNLKNNKDWFLLIKFHPNEDQKQSFNFYERYRKKYALNRCVILKSDVANTYDCVSLSDCVILKHTTVGMEAIIMNRPTINLELIKSWDVSQFESLLSSLIVREEKDLTLFLNKISDAEYKNLFREERKKYLKKHFVNFGNATEKVVEFIKNV